MNLVVSHWSANVAVPAACAAVVAVHLRGMRAARPAATQRRQRPTPGPGLAGVAMQMVIFYCGLGAVVLALVSPLAYWAHQYIWVRSIQDVLLAVMAPGLIVLGAPWLVLARGIGGVPRRHPAAAAAAGSRATPPGGGPGTGGPAAPNTRRGAAKLTVPAWLTSPIAGTIAFNAAWWGWHMPALYDAAARHAAVQAAEVAAYLGLGVVLWLQLIGSRPVTPRFPPLPRVMLVVGTLVSVTVLAMMLIFGNGLLYPAYASASHHGLGVVADQQVGGAVLWAASLPPFFIATVALVLSWLNEEETQALATGFERLLKPRKWAWPSRPGLR